MTGPAGSRPRGFRRHPKPQSTDSAGGVERDSNTDRSATGYGPGSRPQDRSGTGRDRPGSADSPDEGRARRRAKDTKPGGSYRDGTGRNTDGGDHRGGSAAGERRTGHESAAGDRRRDAGPGGKSSRSGGERGDRPGRREQQGRPFGSAAGKPRERDRPAGSAQGDRGRGVGYGGKSSGFGGERPGYRGEGPGRHEKQGRRPDSGGRAADQGAPARGGRPDSRYRSEFGEDRADRAKGGREGGPRSPKGRGTGAGAGRLSREEREPGTRRGDTSGRSAGRGSSPAAEGGDRRGAKGPGRRGDDRRRSEEGSKTPSAGKRSGAGRTRPGRGESAARPKQVKDPARTVALETLRAVRERDAYANLVLPAFLREYSVQGRDAALATELGYGACRSLGVLDAVIAECAGREIADIDGPLLDILRLGTYQLLRTRVEPHAAVHTAVELARAESGSSRAGFVNAVLRRVTERSPDDWVARLAPPDPIGRLAFEYAHPEWIAQAFADALGPDAGELRDLLAADDARPVVHLVAHPGDITAEELALVTGGEEGRWSPYAVYLEGGDPGSLEPVREGMAAVQDEGSQLVALALTRASLHGPDTGRWLDLCAGPGGKTALLGALAGIDGYRVDAVEPSAHRAELVRSATRDMPVEVHIADGRDSGLPAGYDRILVDAPCTGLGALRRRPEARWRRTPGDVADLVALQRELVTAAWDLLRPGGVLVYSTCSPHLPETVAVVADTVRRTGAEQLDARELLPGVTGLGSGPTVQLWPHRHGTDAMFVAALRKPQ